MIGPSSGDLFLDACRRRFVLLCECLLPSKFTWLRGQHLRAIVLLLHQTCDAIGVNSRGLVLESIWRPTPIRTVVSPHGQMTWGTGFYPQRWYGLVNYGWLHDSPGCDRVATAIESYRARGHGSGRLVFHLRPTPKGRHEEGMISKIWFGFTSSSDVYCAVKALSRD